MRTIRQHRGFLLLCSVLIFASGAAVLVLPRLVGGASPVPDHVLIVTGAIGIVMAIVGIAGASIAGMMVAPTAQENREAQAARLARAKEALAAMDAEDEARRQR